MERAFIKIHGIVQGVGFRPFIHRLVRAYSLSGYIKNTSSGVELELEGERAELERFVADVPVKAPKLAVIESVEARYGLAPVGFEDFEIRSSKTENERNTLISPDICICDDCLRELLTPGDRRYRYPFINCTNCGPRFTIIKDVPYDRAKTSMSVFPMCPDCDREYHDIENRRYHAQPDACPVCGPEVFFEDRKSGLAIHDSDAAIEKAREYLKAGKIIAVKGLGGMHLACMPEKAAELRQRKQRDEKPFAVMARDAACVRQFCEVSPDEEEVLAGFRRPIVLLNKKKDGPLSEDRELSENNYIGVMLPYTPLHVLLFGDDIDVLIMTSANLSETPIMFQNNEAFEKLAGIADGFLLHNRDIQTRCDDSLCWILDGNEYFARRSRGYVPFPVGITGQEFKAPVLALGAEQKASFCLNKGSHVFPCQHIGDLKNIETYVHYEAQIRHFERMFDIVPEAVACDLHPDYMSSEFARQSGLPVYPVQHHHAHMASCMADNNLTGEVIGLIWDGTGLGTDGSIWGAECLIGGFERFERFATILPISLIGGDRATKELGRIAYYMLRESGCGRETDPNYEKMLLGGINCPKATSIGRLFDGAAAILGIRQNASYEGQGAVLLEAVGANEPETDAVYSCTMQEFSGIMAFDWRPMVREMTQKPSAAKFMNTLMEAAVLQCLAAREKSGLNRVVLSGGSFQNMYIMQRLPGRLEKEGFEVFHHRRVSCNDEGISLGQLCVLQSRLK